MITKESLLSKLVAEYHPKFKNSKVLRDTILENPEMFNLLGGSKVEGLVEQTVRFVGKHGKWIDDEHQDFNDGSDFKTASISPNPSKPFGTTHQAYISGVCKNGSEKNGALRTIYWNPLKEKLHFIFIPKKIWYEKSVCSNGSIRATYNRISDRFPTWYDWRGTCKQFESFKEFSMYKE